MKRILYIALLVPSFIGAMQPQQNKSIFKGERHEIFLVKFGIIMGAVASIISVPEDYRYDSYKKVMLRVGSRAARGGVAGYLAAVVANSLDRACCLKSL